MQKEDIDPSRKCCLNCSYYEARSGFCRKSPPTPIAVPDNKGAHLMSAFPKIAIPAADFCHEFNANVL